MIKYKSDYTSDELLKRWDEYTSVARFAGNDDTMDLIFVSKRNGEKVRLVRKARSAYEPFSCVFRGMIRSAGKGSEVVGIFTKGLVDYLTVGLIWAFLFYIRSVVIERGGDLVTVNSLTALAIVGGLLMLYNYRKTKRRYTEFISRITGIEYNMFLSKREKTLLDE